MVGQTVTVEAIVVGDFQNGDADAKRNLGGFYLQEELTDSDGNALTSEGIFVFGGAADVTVGDRVRVTATVNEFFGLTELTATRSWSSRPMRSRMSIPWRSISTCRPGATLNQNGEYPARPRGL